MSATHHPDYVRAISGAGVPGVWIPTRRDEACCDHHFSEGISEMTINAMPHARTVDEMREKCPYAALERFRAS